MVAIEQTQAPRPEAAPSRAGRRVSIEERIRALPIRWRIVAIAGLNTAVVLLLAALIWDGAKDLNTSWQDLRQARQSDRLLVSLETETSRLQSLIHRYFNQPQPNLLDEIVHRRAALLELLKTRAVADPAIATSAGELADATERFLAGFDALRTVRTAISRIFESEVLTPAREITGLYAILEGPSRKQDMLIAPSLAKSREAFSEALLKANAYYLSIASSAADDAYRQITTVERTIPVMLDLAENDLQRGALTALGARAAAFRGGLNNLAESFAQQSQLLRDVIDGNQATMAGVIDRVSGQIRTREQQAQTDFDQALSEVYVRVGVVAIAFLVLITAVGIAIAGSISAPLRELMTAMHAIVAGDYDKRVHGITARDEIGEMARAVEVFRENAIAKRRAEGELRSSKERAEHTLSDLRDTQKSLIEAEKLAALGGLVAGVAHEVNNPVGISLTVASSLARRCDAFAAELKEGQLRRSRLSEFVQGTQEAAGQLVGNLQRAGELIQSFKQVAVDRSHEQRRQFDLRHSTDQIVSSLRPGLKKARLDLVTNVPENLLLDSYPGAYGQVLTNLVLNSVTHGFGDGMSGEIRIEAVPLGNNQVELVVSDDGAGMSDDVQRRAFDPFFTTRRNQGGTGLGLHIVYNLVTRRLGGRISFASAPNRGTTFRLVLPLIAPRTEVAATADLLAVTDR